MIKCIESTGERLTIGQREKKALEHIADKLAHYAEQLIILDNRTASLCCDAAISAIEAHTNS